MIKKNENLTDEQIKSISISSLGFGSFFGVLIYLIAETSTVNAIVVSVVLGFLFFMASFYSNAIKKILLEPKDIYKNTEGLQEKNLTALLKRRSVNDFLEYRVYAEEDGLGYYTMRNGRRGFVLRVHPGAFIGQNVEAILTNCLEVINVQGSVANFFTFASRNIEHQIKEFENIHLNTPINVMHPDVLHDMIRSRARHFRKWTNKSVLKGVDLRLRDFINLVSFSFPPETSKETIDTYFAQIKGSLSELHPENFTGQEMVTMVKEILSPEIESWDSPADYTIDMSTQMTNEGVRIRTNSNGNVLIGDSWYAKTITTKNFPEEISLSEFTGLFYDKFGTSVQNTIPSPFLSSLTISYDNVEETNKKLAKVAAWNIKELNKLDSSTKDAHPELHRMAEEARLVTRYQEAGQVPLNAMWTLTIFDNNKTRLEECYGKTVAQFRKKNWSLVQESFGNIALMSMIASLPLNFNDNVKETLQRFRILFLSNNTQIAPLISDTAGSKMTIPYFGRSGQLQGFDFYDSDTNYNVVVVGESGSGKSYSQNDIHAMCLTAGYQIRGIDAGHSYKYLNEFIGGQYISFSEGSKICLNFFTKIILQRKFQTDEKGDTIYDVNNEPLETNELVRIKDSSGVLRNVIHTDEYKTIVPIIGQMGGVNLAATMSESSNLVNDLNTKFLATCVEQAVQDAYWQQAENAGMNTVYRALQDIAKELVKKDRTKDSELLNRFIDSISPYCLPNGMFYGYFNGPNNINFKSSYVIAELDELKNKGDLYNVVLMSFAQTVMAEFFGERATKKIFFVDEAWMILDKIIVVTFLNDLYRRIRKYNGVAMTLTQRIPDFFRNHLTEAMYSNSNWKYFLQMSSDDIEQVANQKKVYLGNLIVRLMKSIKNNKSLKVAEILIQSEKRIMVSRLKTDPLSHYTYSAMGPLEKDYIGELEDKYGISVHDAVRIAAASIEHEISTDEAYMMVKGNDVKMLNDLQKKEELERFSTLIEEAIDMDKIKIFRQTIESLDNSAPIYENLVRIEKEDRTIIGPAQFLNKAKELGKLSSIEKIVIEKTFSHYEKNNEQFSLNFFMSNLHDEELCRFLTNRVAASQASNRFVVEITMDENGDKIDEKLKEFINRLKDYNVRIALDGVGIKNIDFNKLLMLNIDILKLEDTLIQNIEDSQMHLIFLKTIVSFCKNIGVKTVAIHIERESTKEIAQKLEIDYIQGYLIDKPTLVA